MIDSPYLVEAASENRNVRSESPSIETVKGHQLQLDTDKGIQLDIREHPWIRTVLCPVTIFTTKLNLNCFSSCPEYQIKYFSS